MTEVRGFKESEREGGGRRERGSEGEVEFQLSDLHVPMVMER